MHINIQCIRNKINELEAFIVSEASPLDVICVSEHWLHQNELDFFEIKNYHLASTYCRSEFCHGGTLILVKNNLICKPLPHLNNISVEKHCEISAVKIENHNIIIINIYHSPNGDLNIFVKLLENLLNKLDVSKKMVILCGDFNVRFNTSHPANILLIDLLKTYGLEQTIFENTRLSNCIDNIFVNFSTEDCNSYNTEPYLSDHLGQVLEVPLYFSKKALEHQKLIRPITTTGKNKFFDIISTCSWEFVGDHTLDINEKFRIFLNIILQAHNESFQEKLVYFANSHTIKINWFTDELRKMRDHLKFLNETYALHNTEANKKIRDNFRWRYKNAIKNNKIMSNDNHIKKSGNPVKTMWQLINSAKQNAPPIPEPKIEPNVFNDFFINVAGEVIANLPKLDNIDPLHYVKQVESNIELFSFREITYNEVRDILHSLKNSDSKDIYGLNVALIKTIKNHIIIPLTKLINESLRTGIFPDVLKIASVVPIFKKGDTDDIHNYRPISLLPIISKILEKVIKIQITEYLERNNILYKSQFGFRGNMSTTDAILKFTERTLDCFEKGLYSASLFCDLSKAFDCVSHSLLTQKLNKYNFSTNSTLLIKSYLENRKQSVRLNGVTSEELLIKSGVPQGSILGPVLFLIYINDMPNALPNDTCIFYADDSTLQIFDTNIDNLMLKCDDTLSNAKNWFTSNALALNDAKTIKMISSTRDLSKISSNPSSAKFLGVFIDPFLRWDAHIEYLAGQLTKNIYGLRQLSNSLSLDVLKSAYFALCHSRLSYAILAWGHSAGRHRIFGLQRRAIRILGGVGYREETKELFIKLKILTLPSLYALESITYVHSNLNNYITHADMHRYETRHRDEICTEFTRLTRGQTGVNFHGIKLYNLLTNNIKTLPLIKFRSTIKDFLLKNAFFSQDEIERDIASIV